MSESENIETLKRFYESEGVPALLEAISEDFRWEWPEHKDIPWSGVHVGRDGVRKFFDIAGQSGPAMKDFRADDYIAQGNRVVVLGSEVIQQSKSGGLKQILWAHVRRFRSGKIVQLVEYADTAALAEALGQIRQDG